MIKRSKINLLFFIIHSLIKIKGFKWISEKLEERKNKIKVFNDLALEHAYQVCSEIEEVRDKHLLKNKAQCLHRSLLGFFIFLQKNIEVTFCLGIHKEKFEAHAWLEYKNKVINDEHDAIKKNFNVIYKF
ncbi:lasso peptide biosynthesis B2 protein [Cytobacillus sp.]|uniref:lasso peptide biosynthesis B2 protein n=1 Tax=Cytobacillus sp. TaxID=2675269 RepID=UPI0028BD4BB4|nr:lasso peptide biosynthesis B2 protein [Cytobacillus sp.]